MSRRKPETTSAHEIAAGHVELPIVYYDAAAVFAYFWCDHARTGPLLHGTGMTAVGFGRGRALVVLAFFNYYDTSIGPYHEVGTTIAAYPSAGKAPLMPTFGLFRRVKRRKVGFFVLDLPVSTEIACSAGRELWGYPKFVTETPWSVESGRFTGKVQDPYSDAPLLTFKAAFGRGAPVPASDLLLYSHLDDEILQTIVEVHATAYTSRGAGAHLAVSPDHHRMADNLCDLGLDGAHPFVVQSAPMYKSTLHSGAVHSRFPSPRLAYPT